jgi:hypothetical protein
MMPSGESPLAKAGSAVVSVMASTARQVTLAEGFHFIFIPSVRGSRKDGAGLSLDPPVPPAVDARPVVNPWLGAIPQAQRPDGAAGYSA